MVVYSQLTTPIGKPRTRLVMRKFLTRVQKASFVHYVYGSFTVHVTDEAIIYALLQINQLSQTSHHK